MLGPPVEVKTVQSNNFLGSQCGPWNGEMTQLEDVGRDQRTCTDLGDNVKNEQVLGGPSAVRGTAKRSKSGVQCRAGSDGPGGRVVTRECPVIHSGHSATLDGVGEEDTLLHSPNRHETGYKRN